MNDCFHFVTLDNGWRVGRFYPLEEIAGVSHMVTTRQSLDTHTVRYDHPEAGRQIAAAMNLAGTAFANQVHGNVVLAVRQGGFAGDADGLTTHHADLALMTRSADCPLILAVDTVGGAIGSAHASWRGTAARMAQMLIERLRTEYNADPANIVACICPSAGPCCYEVGPEVVQAFAQNVGSHTAEFFAPTERAQRLDLWAANRDQLLRSGLKEKNIHVAGMCTICRRDIFPSHRAEGDAAGRFAAVIANTRRR